MPRLYKLVTQAYEAWGYGFAEARVTARALACHRRESVRVLEMEPEEVISWKLAFQVPGTLEDLEGPLEPDQSDYWGSGALDPGNCCGAL
jgi:hypothetical protein